MKKLLSVVLVGVALTGCAGLKLQDPLPFDRQANLTARPQSGRALITIENGGVSPLYNPGQPRAKGMLVPCDYIAPTCISYLYW